MPKFTVIRYHTVIDEWYDVEADNEDAAIQHIVEHVDIQPDNVINKDAGDYEAEEQREEQA